MERRFEEIRNQLIADCRVEPNVFADLLPRLDEFAQPFVVCLDREAEQGHAQTYLAGLLSNLERKNAERMAYRRDQHRIGLQSFLGGSDWDHRPLIVELVAQVAARLGTPDGVVVFDPSGFPKKGTKSVGVARQWLGRLGKVDNGQVGIYMGYASEVDHALVDVRLYLPKAWTRDRKRCLEAGVPKDQIRHRTRHELALEMLDTHGKHLPHSWVTGDDEMGRSTQFRRQLAERQERYLLAVPSNTTIRDLDVPPPFSSGRGRPRKTPFRQVRKWISDLAEDDWMRLTVRDGEKGPLEVEIVTRRVQARTEKRRVGPEEMLVVIRWRDEDATRKTDYYLSNAPPETPTAEFARAAKAEHRIEESLQRAKSEAGLAGYQVRKWNGWHHHQVLSLIATWFLVVESLRGRQWTPTLTVPRIRQAFSLVLHRALDCDTPQRIARECERILVRNELARLYHHKARNRLPPRKVPPIASG